MREEAEDKEKKKREKEEKEALKVLLRDQRRRIRNKCEEFEMNRSHTEDLSLALPLEQVRARGCCVARAWCDYVVIVV